MKLTSRATNFLNMDLARNPVFMTFTTFVTFMLASSWSRSGPCYFWTIVMSLVLPCRSPYESALGTCLAEVRFQNVTNAAFCDWLLRRTNCKQMVSREGCA